MFRFIVAALMVLASVPLRAQDAPKKFKTSYQIVRFVTAEKTGFDGRGVCVAKKNESKVYWFKEFPVKIDRMESCITLTSKQARGRQEFTMAVVSADDNTLVEMNGFMDFGDAGRVSQVVQWDELEVLVPGKYQVVVSIDDDEVLRYTIHFEKRSGRR